jgi:hypothetical protein
VTDIAVLLFTLLLPFGIALGYVVSGWIFRAPAAVLRFIFAVWNVIDKHLLQRFFPPEFETYRLEPYTLKYYRVFDDIYREPSVRYYRVFA